MIEKLGNVVLNYKNYSGNDYYSDGDVEDTLLEITQKYDENDFNRIIGEKNDWAILYHLSPIRSNIIEWIPITSNDSVLEVGSGCGAITGVLSNKAKKVTCIELSKKRSLINANRNREKSNIEIMVGNFEDVESDLNEKYDYITLIGVFEYAEAYIKSSQPYQDFLRKITKRLKKNGKVIIAIENKLGLKYWAGCQEDHVGKYYENLEGYPTSSGVKTFSKHQLENIIKESGLEYLKFYYPFPDYKLPMTIYSDEYLPKKGDLSNNICNFDRDRIVLFDETKVYDSLLDENMFPAFSNSFLVICSEGESDV